MKAVIMEICKDYCIVLTTDGQFLKQKIPAGVFEVGDEIKVSKEYVYNPRKISINWVKNIALAASVAVILIIGSIFSIWYMKYFSATEERDFAAENIVIEEPAGDEAAAELYREPEEGTKEESLMSIAEEEKTITFEQTYSFDEQPEVEDDIGEIIRFSYKIIDGINLKIKLININSILTFNGTIKLNLLFSDEGRSRTETIVLEGFEPGKLEEYPVFLKTEEVKLNLEITGSAY